MSRCRFRYEIRRWRDGVIPDLSYAVGSPVRVGEGDALARDVFGLVPLVPTPVWGRDELHAGEMWNSNSVTSWLLARSGIDIEHIRPPFDGRAPGWDAGLAVAGRVELEQASPLAEKVQAWLAVTHDANTNTTGYWYHQQRQQPAEAVLDEAFQDVLVDELARLTGVEVAEMSRTRRSNGSCDSTSSCAADPCTLRVDETGR